MRIRLLILTLIFLFFGVGVVLASDPPSPSSPQNNSTTTSSKLQWQTPGYNLYSSNPYRVQVDDDSAFSSPNKDYYTDNTYYTPTLSYGTWYWRVKAKDISANWSNWSDAWAFILSASTSAPTPTPAPTTQPTSTSQTSQSSSTGTSFTASGIPSQINSDQPFTAAINLSLPDSPNTTFYLKGAFKKADGSNYFGLTKVSGSWVKNNSSYSNQYKITTDPSGNWSGKLEVQPDADDSGFTGTDSYVFKAGRYTLSGSGPVWSDESNIQITATNITTPTSQDSSSKTVSKTETVSSFQPVDSAASEYIISQSSPKLNYQIATVAGASSSATPSASAKVLSQQSFNLLPFVGGGLILTGMGIFSYVYLRNKKAI